MIAPYAAGELVQTLCLEPPDPEWRRDEGRWSKALTVIADDGGFRLMVNWPPHGKVWIFRPWTRSYIEGTEGDPGTIDPITEEM